MTGGKIAIRLVAPAKVDGRWRGVGETIPVSYDVALQLEAAGAIEALGTSMGELVPGAPGFDQEVAAVAKMLADAAVKAAVEAATAEVIADRDATRDRLHEIESEARSLQARNFELEAELADLKASAVHQDRPATEAPQKGAAAKKG